MRRSLRIGAVAIILVGALACVGIIFWQEELRYQLPTSVPDNYREVLIGEHVTLPASFDSTHAQFLHFYNPDCPCSRFNAKHLRSLIGAHRDSIRITIVVASQDEVEAATSEFGEEIDIVIDKQRRITSACGVYSTPQAAIVDSNGNLYYRGNYNASRYCTARATNFAELALLALINNQRPPEFGLLATQSYGCELKKQNVLIAY
ncbi:DUF6436 domain-containing protein [Pseudochryseolinea flava]|uniref:AhpC/TSA family protein n=1 Tax=Pseudochryseolinea flava TaxID=2059302 RepID=A0A364Y8S3_9BACT|nr:AhpC/TSA family protein [Pseudochryseolinea flava]RAW02250.1 AhpC/TSA family protein [Pseudochryseolinea flava]